MQHKAKFILGKYNSRNEKYITIVASGLVNCYRLEEELDDVVNEIKRHMD